MRDCGFQLSLTHPIREACPLSPSDFILFPNLKKASTGQRFTDDDAIIETVIQFLQSHNLKSSFPTI